MNSPSQLDLFYFLDSKAASIPKIKRRDKILDLVGSGVKFPIRKSTRDANPARSLTHRTVMANR